LEATVTEPSLKLQDEAALATLVKKTSDDAIEKRMISTLSQVDSVREVEANKWMGQDSLRLDLETVAYCSLSYVVEVGGFDWSKL
jgi:hypothetical protein